jgi:hypothetical protein
MQFSGLARAEVTCPPAQPRVLFTCATVAHEQVRLCGSPDLQQPEARLVLVVEAEDGKSLLRVGEQKHPGELFSGNQLSGGSLSLNYLRYHDADGRDLVLMSGHDQTNAIAALGELLGQDQPAHWWRCDDDWQSDLGPALFIESNMAAAPSMGDMP